MAHRPQFRIQITPSNYTQTHTLTHDTSIYAARLKYYYYVAACSLNKGSQEEQPSNEPTNNSAVVV